MTGLARTRGAVLDGVEGRLVEVQAHVGNGLPGMTIVGLPDAAVNESRERIRAAMQSAGARWPEQRMTVGLLPSAQRKRGSGLDLAIAASVLTASQQLPAGPLDDCVLIGELGLDGAVRPVEGTFVRIVAARRAGAFAVVAPQSLREAALAASLVDQSRPAAGRGTSAVGAVRSLQHLAQVCRGSESFDGPDRSVLDEPERSGSAPDLGQVRGQAAARAALEVCAAGGHHLFLIGPPGVGKTMLAEALPGLLPPLSHAEALEVAAVRSLLDPDPVQAVPNERPFVAPHHSTSSSALVGGGSNGRIRPGLVTAAHRGVLFLDEAPEFDRRSLQSLRQPLESGAITVHRAELGARLPARFQLVLAANPCPCGKFLGTGAQCRCAVAARLRYLAKLRGPLLDRVDIGCALGRPSVAELAGAAPDESSATVRDRVLSARERMSTRMAAVGCATNAEAPAWWVTGDGSPQSAATASLLRLVSSGALSVRGMHRTVRVAWTLADLAGTARPGPDEVARALALRVPGEWT